MKKRTSFAIIALTILMFVLCAVGCGKQVTAPTNIKIDEDHNMTWLSVEGSRRYNIEIKNIETKEVTVASPRRNSYSLEMLPQGKYSIKIKAVASSSSNKDSDWSKEVIFEKPYEPGCVFMLINNGTEYELLRAGTAMGDVVIGDTYRGKPVTSIAKNAFKANGRITSIKLGNNIESIGDSAFYNCLILNSIELPNNLKTIGTSAFQGCQAITTMEIPDTVTSIGKSAFTNCYSLTTIKLSSSITILREKLFQGCKKLENITIPDGVTEIQKYAISGSDVMTEINVPANVKILGDYAFCKLKQLEAVNFAQDSQLEIVGKYVFYDCDILQSIELPEGLLTIDDHAFFGAESLSEVNIPSTVTRVGIKAFEDTAIYASLEESFKNGGDPLYYIDDWIIGLDRDYLKEKIKLEKKDFSSTVKGIADEVFKWWALKLEVLVLPDSLQYIGIRAFCGNNSLVTVVVQPNSVKVIRVQAFASCKNLSYVSLGEGLEGIEEFCFEDCVLLGNRPENERWIPDSVNKIGGMAFRNTSLYNSQIDSGTVYADKWLVNAGGSDEITVKEGTIGIADYAFYMTRVIKLKGKGLDDIKYIGKGAFLGCQLLQSMTIGDNIKKIEPFTFYDCISLYMVSLPTTLEEIGQSAFFNCLTLSEINMSRTKVSTIGDFAFYNATNLKSVEFSKYTTSIGKKAFYSNISLEAIAIPGEVEEIGEKTFFGCVALKEVEIGEGVKTIGNSAFSGCVALEEVTLPSTVESIGNHSFFGCTGLKTISLGENLKTIGDYSFYNLTSLRYINIPSTVESIGKLAFRNCEQLESITLNGNIKEIGLHAFLECTNTTIYMDNMNNVEDWNLNWNSSDRPIVEGSTFSEDGSYVVSITIGQDGIINVNAINGITAPTRAGYIFKGWAASQGSNEVVFEAGGIVNVTAGTILYSVWEEAPLPEPEEGEI